jgi:hypothetical protein
MGGTSTNKVRAAVAAPASLLAVTTYVPDDAASGVPEMTPEVGSSVKPAGNAGLTEYPVTGPVTVGG